MKQTTFNFKAQFAPRIEDGSKTSTIRVFAKTQPPVVGDTLKLFTGMRQKNCRKLKEVKCAKVHAIEIGKDYINLGGLFLVPRLQRKFAVRDGFEDLAELRSFFRAHYGLPFRGVWVSWA
jgi:hypothetical protein